MTTAVTIVEPTTLIRDWLRTLDLSVGGDVYAGGRPSTEPVPAIVVFRVGGGIVDYQDDGLYQFDCLAGNARTANALASELVSALISAATPLALSTATSLRGFYGVQLLPDVTPDPDLQRTIVTAQATTITTPS
jgi:hypothetical protein